MYISLNLLKKLVSIDEYIHAIKEETEQTINSFKPVFGYENYNQMKNSIYVRSFKKEIRIENKYMLDVFILHYLILKIFYGSISKVGNKTFIQFPQTRVRLSKVLFSIKKQDEPIVYNKTNHNITLSEDFILKRLKDDFDYVPNYLGLIKSTYLHQVFNENSKEHIFLILDVLKNINDKINHHNVKINKMVSLNQMSKNIRTYILSNVFIENMENTCFRDDYLLKESISNFDNSNEKYLGKFLDSIDKIKSLIENVKESMNNSECPISTFNDADIVLDIDFEKNIVQFEANANVFGSFEFYHSSFEFKF